MNKRGRDKRKIAKAMERIGNLAECITDGIERTQAQEVFCLSHCTNIECSRNMDSIAYRKAMRMGKQVSCAELAGGCKEFRGEELTVEEHARVLQKYCEEYLPGACKGCQFEGKNGNKCKLLWIPAQWKIGLRKGRKEE